MEGHQELGREPRARERYCFRILGNRSSGHFSDFHRHADDAILGGAALPSAALKLYFYVRASAP